MTREELQSLLETCGADADRWPPEVRTAALRLIAHDEEAARMFREAQTLDRLLAADAPPPASLPAADMARAIMACPDSTAGSGERGDTAAGARATIIPFPSASHGGHEIGGDDRNAKDRSPSPAADDDRPLHWMAAGVLAASLLLGVLLGSTLSISPVGEQLLEPVRLALANDGLGEIVRLASPAEGGDLP